MDPRDPRNLWTAKKDDKKFLGDYFAAKKSSQFSQNDELEYAKNAAEKNHLWSLKYICYDLNLRRCNGLDTVKILLASITALTNGGSDDCAKFLIEEEKLDINRPNLLTKVIDNRESTDSQVETQVRFLLKYNPEIDTIGFCGDFTTSSPLCMAATRGFPKTLNLLLSAQADPVFFIPYTDARPNRVALDYAMRLVAPYDDISFSQGHIECTQLLLQHALAFPEKHAVYPAYRNFILCRIQNKTLSYPFDAIAHVLQHRDTLEKFGPAILGYNAQAPITKQLADALVDTCNSFLAASKMLSIPYSLIVSYAKTPGTLFRRGAEIRKKAQWAPQIEVVEEKTQLTKAAAGAGASAGATAALISSAKPHPR